MTKLSRLLLLFSIAICSFGVSGQTLWETRPDYDISSDPFFDGIDTVPPSELDEWAVVQEAHTLTGLETSITVETPEGSNLTFYRDYSDVDTFGVITWFGINSDNINYPFSVAMFTIHGDSLLGYYTISDETAYMLTPLGNGFFVLYEHEYDHDACDTELEPHYGDTTLSYARLTSQIINYISCDGLDIYRMIVAYTPEFANTFPLTNRQKLINEYIQAMVDSTNRTYINSNTNIRVRLALSYETDSEFGSKDSDSPAFAKKDYKFLWSSRSDKYDEIHDLRTQYKADAAILLVSYNDGGRAHRRSNTAIYGKRGAGPPVNGVPGRYGVAHEVGHLFNLEHHREDFTWFAQKGLDRKKAYGYRGWIGGFNTVMAKGHLQTRDHLYSDPGYNFPNGQHAGNSRAKARNYMETNRRNLFAYNDPTDWYLTGRTIYFNQMTSQFAFNSVKLQNYTIQGGAVAHYRAGNHVELLSGTIINQGATVELEVRNRSNTQVFRKSSGDDRQSTILSNESTGLTVFPNPTTTDVTVYSEFGAEVNYHIQLIDLTGKVVYQLQGYGAVLNEKIPLANFEQGVFVLKAVIDNKVYQQKIVKSE